MVASVTTGPVIIVTSLPVRRRGRRLRPHRVLQLAVVRKILIANILAALDTEALRIATRRA